MRRRFRHSGVLASLLLVAGCTTSPNKQRAAQNAGQPLPILSEAANVPPSESIETNTEAPLREHPEARQFGFASWYGKAFHGRRTASGERFNVNAMTAAHRTLPLGSWVRVAVAATRQSVVVRINHRGPFVRSRVIDLSYGAAVALGIARSGTAKVELRPVESVPSAT